MFKKYDEAFERERRKQLQFL